MTEHQDRAATEGRRQGAECYIPLRSRLVTARALQTGEKALEYPIYALEIGKLNLGMIRSG